MHADDRQYKQPAVPVPAIPNPEQGLIEPSMEKLPELPPTTTGRSMVRTRMPDAPGGIGLSIRPVSREACVPRLPQDGEDTWDRPSNGKPAPSA